MSELVLHGPQISTYGRICAVIAEECEVTWRVDATSAADVRARGLHPFGKTPAAVIDGETFIETRAICAYLDAAYGQRRFTPNDPLSSARMHQWISVADNYLFAVSEPGLVLPRLVAPLMERQADERLVARALPAIDWQLGLFCDRLEEARYLAGAEISLADFHAVPMVQAIALTNEGSAMVRAKLPLHRWLSNLASRPSAKATRWPIEGTSG